MLTEEQLYIDKTRALLNDQDYGFLREEGLKYVESLASNLWTDYFIGVSELFCNVTLCFFVVN